MSETWKIAAILAADAVGYSRLMGEDEAGTARGTETSLSYTADPDQPWRAHRQDDGPCAQQTARIV